MVGASVKNDVLDVSLIIVNWNTKELLLDCIQSLYEETRDSQIEIIVVDNHSSDGSAEAVRDRFPQVRIIRNERNLGFAKANNIGITQSTGRYVCLVNSDILVLDCCVDRMRLFMESNPQVGALAPKTLNEFRRVRRNCREFPSLRNIFSQALFLDKLFPKSRLFRGRLLKNYHYDTPLEVEVLSGCFLMVRRATLEHVGLLDESFFFYGEDVDWGKRFRAAGWKAVLYPEAKAIHYGGASSKAANIRFLLERLKADHQYWKKHHGRFEQTLYVLLTVLHYSIRTAGWFFIYLFKISDRGVSLDKLRGNAAQLMWHLWNRQRKKAW